VAKVGVDEQFHESEVLRASVMLRNVLSPYGLLNMWAHYVLMC